MEARMKAENAIPLIQQRPWTKEEREGAVKRYIGVMALQVSRKLLQDRGWIVKRYRLHPGSWPDGIDSEYDRWYCPEHWTDEGVFIGLDVTEKHVTENQEAHVTENRRGRPKRVDALSSARRVAKHRARKKDGAV
jgi:hypothetical protein